MSGAMLAMPAFAQSAQGDVAVTIYNNNLALVQDKREMRLPAGKSKQDFPDVSAQIRPETVTIGAPGATIVEQNFDFDLLSPEALMEKAVGQNVTVVRGGQSLPAKVLAYNDGTVVEIGGRIEVLGKDDRVIFPSLPPSLRARPTLSVTLDADAAGARPVTLSSLQVVVRLFRRIPLPLLPHRILHRRRRRPPPATGDAQLPDLWHGLEVRLCCAVRREGGQDRRPGLADADQQ
ncbi:MAG: DUF4139 domain-containing protein [Sphingomonas sp.]